MNLDKIIEWAKLKSTVIFLVEKNSTNVALKRAVYFNVVESMNFESRSRTSDSKQPEGNTTQVMDNLTGNISLSGWLSFNNWNITRYLTDVVLGTGRYVVDFEPLRRKATLEEWKEHKTLLTLFGVEEKKEDLVIISMNESTSVRYSPTSNFNLSLTLAEIDPSLNISNKKSTTEIK